MERLEKLLQELVNQTKALAASLELLHGGIGSWFLRTWEIGNLEGLEETETELRKSRRKVVVGGKRKGKEPESTLEVGPEVVPEDVEMTLQ